MTKTQNMDSAPNIKETLCFLFILSIFLNWNNTCVNASVIEVVPSGRDCWGRIILTHKEYPRNLTAQMIRNETSALKIKRLLILDKHPTNKKYLKFKAVKVFGECCWTFWNRRGASFSSSIPGTYTNDWPVRKLEVRNSCEINEKNPCAGRDCDETNKRDTTLFPNADHSDSSSTEIRSATKTKVDYNLATNPNSITNAKNTINKYENKDTIATEDYETSQTGGATYNKVSRHLSKPKQSTGKIDNNPLNLIQNSESKNYSEHIRLWPYTLIIILVPTFNL